MASISKKAKISFVCQECGTESPKWAGQCSGCGNWNTLVEEKVTAPEKPVHGLGKSKQRVKAQKLSEIDLSESSRIPVGMEEFHRVMGGGIMEGSLTLLAGDPGIGKSTLMTELGKYLKDAKILYVSCEESPKQVRMRAERTGVKSDNFYLYPETDISLILQEIETMAPDIVIVDSIQTVFSAHIPSAPGSVAQVRECTAGLLRATKRSNTASFIIGHVTKEGMIAGPRILEHMVDTVLYFEGERHHSYRILRAVKNRFGSTNEIGLFEMTSTGLREVSNPSEILLSQREIGLSGSAVVCSMEGTRPLLVEIQSLVSPANYGTPQRTTSGFDGRRLQMLLAVLEKRAGMGIGNHDVFLNVAGGIRLEEPAVDLGAACAIASGLMDRVIDAETVIMGEIGLGGEIRTVSRIERRLSEASKLGFKHAIIPQGNQKGLNKVKGIEINAVSTLEEALDKII